MEKPTMQHNTVGEIIIETLEQAGVKNCYGIVGDTLNHITDAIRHSQIKWVHVRHEEVAAMAAGAESYMTGGLSACAGSCGPGSLHTINGLLEAHRNRSPVVMIATQVALTELGMEFPQEVDLASIFKTCSHFCATLPSPSQARRLTAQAAQAAINLRGVAVLIVPGDLAGKCATRPALQLPIIHSRSAPHPIAELDEMAKLLLSSERLALYCGPAAPMPMPKSWSWRAGSRPRWRTPAAPRTSSNRTTFQCGHDRHAGYRIGLSRHAGCDTLLLLGADFAWTSFYPHRATIVQVDNQATHLGRRHPVKLGGG
jgi:pyruvate dehydrogenase (quinone)